MVIGRLVDVSEIDYLKKLCLIFSPNLSYSKIFNKCVKINQSARRDDVLNPISAKTEWAKLNLSLPDKISLYVGCQCNSLATTTGTRLIS